MTTGLEPGTAVEKFMNGLRDRNPGEEEFHQAVQEVAESVMPFILDNPEYAEARILERMTEPDRIVSFRVVWEDDEGNVRVNRAWRVQFNNSIGPYKGGLRFDRSVNQSILKFLGFEQCFKNALTGMPMGGAKGGANFNPKGKSDREVMRFCHSLMVELQRHIGPDTDVPAGDIGVGAREIGYLFGQYKRIENRFNGVLTGKELVFGGSRVRREATGYGVVYFAQNMLKHGGEGIDGLRCAISGSGNVAIYTAEKAIEFGAKVITMSDSSGTIHDPEGIDEEKLSFIRDLKEHRRGRIAEYADEYECDYLEDERPWKVACDIAFPCATQNELEEDDAQALLDNGCRAVVEGANMPTTSGAIRKLHEQGALFGPGKAANAGGVAVSGLEQTQNAIRMPWDRERVDEQLQLTMQEIHDQCTEWGTEDGGRVNYVRGANLAGFKRVADAMLDYGTL